MEWDEKWLFLPKDFDGKGNCQEKLPYPESQSIGCLYCRQEALFQPFTAKLVVKGLLSGATTDHKIQLCLAGLGHSRKTQQSWWR